jgi:hypothetical protein
LNGICVTNYYEGKVYKTKKEIYLSKNVQLLPPNSQLPADNHKIPFHVDIPFRLPQSYMKKILNTKFCISYNCVVNLNLSGFGNNGRCEREFTLKRCDFSNYFPMLREPIARESIKRFYGYFGRSQPIIMKVSIPYAGLAAGEEIPVKVNYENMSNLKVERTKIALVESILHKDEMIHVKEDPLIVDYVEGVGRKESKEITFNLKVPESVKCSDFLYSNLLKTRHSIAVVGIVKGWHFNPKISVPVVLGVARLEIDLSEHRHENEKDNAAVVSFHVIN